MSAAPTWFGPAAVRLAGLCGAGLGWTPAAFWRATPAEVAAVVAALTPEEAAPVTAAELKRLESDHG